jgi:hypothetical protein
MPANTSPIFTLTPNTGTARLVAANTAADGSGTVYQLLAAGSNGTRVDAVRFRNSQATVALSAANLFRIYYSPTVVTGAPGSGSYRLVGEVASAGSVTRTVGTTVGQTAIYTFDIPLFMASGSALYVCQSAYAGPADQYDAQAFAGDY